MRKSSTPPVITPTDMWLAKIYRILRMATSSIQNGGEGSSNVTVFDVVTEEVGNSLTNPAITNTVLAIIWQNQAYNTDSFDRDGDTITWTNGSEFGIGETVTIIMQKP